MISPIDIISEIERNARKQINKGNNMEAQKLLLNALKSIKDENFLDNELPDIAFILKKIHADFLAIKDYDGGFQSLYLIHKIMRGKLSITNDLKNYLNKIPENYDVSKYNVEIREMAKNNWEIIELLKIIEENYKKKISN
ncbi:MAG: hypothetical protein ACP5TO_02970 [Thermoplasmata archaeon]